MLSADQPECHVCPRAGVVEVIVLVVGQEHRLRSCAWHVLTTGLGPDTQTAIHAAVQQRAGAAR